MKKFGLLAIVLAYGLILTGCELFHEPEVCCTVEIDDNENNEENTNLDATETQESEIIDLK